MVHFAVGSDCRSLPKPWEGILLLVADPGPRGPGNLDSMAERASGHSGTVRYASPVCANTGQLAGSSDQNARGE